MPKFLGKSTPPTPPPTRRKSSQPPQQSSEWTETEAEEESTNNGRVPTKESLEHLDEDFKDGLQQFMEEDSPVWPDNEEL